MNMPPVFSIIVPVYKVEEYLDRCVASLLSQTYKDIEIILVDDGSPDRCPAMCEEYAAKDSRVKVIHKTNGGLSDARNKGIEVSSGRYIMFVDSDDYIDTNACELLISYIEKTPDVIVTDGNTFGGKVNLKHYPLEIGRIYSGKEYVKQCITKGRLPMAACLYIYKKSYLADNNLYFKKGILHEDEQFTPRALLGAGSIVYTGISCYNYIIRKNSLTTQADRRKNAKDLYNTYIELKRLYDEIADDKLRKGLLDSLSCGYLSLFQSAKLYQYGDEYIHKSFIIKNSYRAKTKMRAFVYCISPAAYWHIISLIKR